MVRILAVLLFFAVLSPAVAAPNCIRAAQPYQLTGETVKWSAKIARGSECLQGLRWSFMQIYNVQLLREPTQGKVSIVGSGFRYHSSVDDQSTEDAFTLIVTGKNRHTPGKTVIEVVVTEPDRYMASNLIEWCDGCQT
jgi:pheromone shutdown protein TraB